MAERTRRRVASFGHSSTANPIRRLQRSEWHVRDNKASLVRSFERNLGHALKFHFQRESTVISNFLADPVEDGCGEIRSRYVSDCDYLGSILSHLKLRYRRNHFENLGEEMDD